MSERFIDSLFSQGSKLTGHTDFVAVCNHCITQNPQPIHLMLLSKVMYCARATCRFLFRGALIFMFKNNDLQGTDSRYNVRVCLSTVGVKKGQVTVICKILA